MRQIRVHPFVRSVIAAAALLGSQTALVQAQACFGSTDPEYRFSASVVSEGTGAYDVARGDQGGAGVTVGFQVPGVLGAEVGWGHRRWYEQRNDTNRLHARVAYAPGALCPVLSAEHESDELFLTPRNALTRSNTEVMAGLAFGRSFDLGRRAAVAPHAAVLTGYRFSDGRTSRSSISASDSASAPSS